MPYIARNFTVLPIMIAFILFSGAASSGLLYYNDGTVNDFSETFGDVAVDVPWNASFLPGGFMKGTPDDVPPFNTITNKGLVTLQGAAGGVAGGGFRFQVAPAAGPQGRRGAIVIPYGTQAQIKDKAGSAWRAKFKKIGRALGVNAKKAMEIWRDEGLRFGGKVSKLVKYTGDPLVSISPDDIASSDLDPFNTSAVSSALIDDNVLVFFWEVAGTRDMGVLDILFGDFELNTGYKDVLHHFPYLAVLDGVGPADFGIAPSSASIIRFNGDSLPGSDPFVGSMAIAVSDPVLISAPGSLWLLMISTFAVIRRYGSLGSGLKYKVAA